MSRRGPRVKRTADDWAREYFKDRPHASLSPERSAQLMRAAVGLPQAAKAGLPDSIPRPAATEAGVDLAGFLEGCRQAAMDGYGMATLIALRACMIYQPDTPLPRWIRAFVSTAIGGWIDHTWPSLEEAFQAKRERTKAENAHFRANWSGQILADLAKAEGAGVARDRELFQAVGEHYGCSFATVERIWQDGAAWRSHDKSKPHK